MTHKYGVLIGRFQTFHIGHQSIINQIIDNGLEPIIFVGSAQEFNTKKNPYHVLDRIAMIKLVYPEARVFALEDKSCWTKWVEQLVNALDLLLDTDHSNITIYTHNKPEDLQNFEYKDIEYTNEYYSKIFEFEGMHTTDLKLSNIPIRASEIRDDLEGNRHFLDHRIYDYIKGLSNDSTASTTATGNARSTAAS